MTQGVYNPHAVCERFGKDMFSKSQAKSAAKQASRRTGANINAYLCRACGRWHIGCRRFR